MNAHLISAATILRWTARASSLFCVFLLMLFLFGSRVEKWPNLAQVMELMLFPCGIIVGLSLAWWREGIGAMVAAISLLGFYILYGVTNGGAVPRGPWFIIFTSPTKFH